MAFETYNIVQDSTGKIVQQIGVDTDVAPTGVTDNTPASHTAYVGASTDSPLEWYYIGSTKTARPAITTVATWNTTSITANGSSTATLGASLPNPTKILVTVPAAEGLDYPGEITETSGSFSLTTTVPGEYTVVADAFPYLQYSTTITAN